MISKELQKMDKKEEKSETDYIKEGQIQLLEIIKRKLDLHTEIEEARNTS